MTKIDYIKSSLDNVQELIRFTDQKVGTALVIAGIEVTVFYDLAKNSVVSFSTLLFWPVLSFLCGAIFVVDVATAVCIGILAVLRPRFAIGYHKEYSIYYFGHVGTGSKTLLHKKVQQLTEARQLRELTDQLYENSRILNLKNRRCSVLMLLIFISILSLVAYVLSSPK